MLDGVGLKKSTPTRSNKKQQVSNTLQGNKDQFNRKLAILLDCWTKKSQNRVRNS